jgi:dihydrofolate reductase
MSRLVVTENITIDGVVDQAKPWWHLDDAVDNTDIIAVTNEQMLAADAFLIGRDTFEAMRAFWPRQAHDSTGVAEYLDRVTKYVVSSTIDDPDWEGTIVLSGDVKQQIARLKRPPGRDIVATGSIRLVQDLQRFGLVDEYRLFVYPYLVGTGRRLFTDEDIWRELRLLETRAFPSGIVMLRYAQG